MRLQLGRQAVPLGKKKKKQSRESEKMHKARVPQALQITFLSLKLTDLHGDY